MHLSHVHIENFRVFGSAADHMHLDLRLRPGLNLLVGENDGGKSAVVDAVRQVLGTTTHEYHRLTAEDFHASGAVRATSLSIVCAFINLSLDEEASFLEHLTREGGQPPKLVIRLDARLLPGGRVSRTTRTGSITGGVLDDDAREYLECTYLRPLRDAEAALSGGRGSRLAQLLDSHPNFAPERINDFGALGGATPSTIVGIMRAAEHAIAGTEAEKRTTDALNTQYLSGLSIGTQPINAGMGIAKQAELRQILEKFDLGFQPAAATDLPTRRGLGLQNALFMAAELLLLGDTADEGFPLLLVEEPEAHLHPQMQLQVTEFLQARCSRSAGPPVQVLMTSHSPTLSSKVPIEAITLLAGGKAYSLDKGLTKLDDSDYRFLSRFLDDTKANLFFARGVLIVEGEGEQLLLPTVAELLGYPLTKAAVSIVNVGSRGLFRYSRIFQRTSGASPPIRVACVADRDIVPRAASGYVTRPTKRPPKKFYDDEYNKDDLDAALAKHKEGDCGAVRTFVSPGWTLEYDLAAAGLAREVHAAVKIARRSKAGDRLEDATIEAIRAQAKVEFDTDLANLPPDQAAAAIYEPVKQKQASKTETAQFLARELRDGKLSRAELQLKLPEYLVSAIKHVVGA